MSPVTAKAEKRLALFYKVISDGAMSIMAEITTLFYRRMLIDKRSLFIRMTIIAEIINSESL
jgi:hypothetical protein